jgi:hypothetical protein
MTDITPYFAFEEDSLIVPFEKIITCFIAKLDPSQYPEDFESNEDIYQITIKQEGAENNTETLVSEDILNDFKNKYKTYLKHRITSAKPNNELLASHMEDTEVLFKTLENKIDDTLNKIVEHAGKHIDSIVDESRKILDDNRSYNDKIEKDLKDLSKLKELIGNFIVDVEEEALSGELVDEENVPLSN